MANVTITDGPKASEDGAFDNVEREQNSGSLSLITRMFNCGPKSAPSSDSELSRITLSVPLKTETPVCISVHGGVPPVGSAWRLNIRS